MTLKKTRIAPTPSGYLHLGNVLSFLITVTLAKRHRIKVLLRIDDLDKQRVKRRYVEDIFDTLDFLEIPYDEGPKNIQEFQSSFSQFHRMELYQNRLQELKEKNTLFSCDCSRKKIAKMNKKGYYTGFCKNRNIPLDKPDCNRRFATSNEKPILVNQLDTAPLNTRITASMRDFVIQKKDGLPSYQIASVVDDDYFGVDFIVRGRDLWDSTIAQLYMSQYLDNLKFEKTVFHHHPLMLDAKNKKMSKSTGTTSIQHFRKSGYKKDDIYKILGSFLQIDAPVRSFEDFSASFKL